MLFFRRYREGRYSWCSPLLFALVCAAVARGFMAEAAYSEPACHSEQSDESPRRPWREISRCARNDRYDASNYVALAIVPKITAHNHPFLSFRATRGISNQPSLKSFHSGLTEATKLFFFSRRHFFISFSRVMAA